MELSKLALSSKESPSFYLVKETIEIVERHLHSISFDEKCFKAVINGSNCTSTKDLFKEFKIALHFPDYFGNNWDSFDECLSDLTWINEEVIIILMNNTEKLLIDENKDQLEIFLNIIDEVVLAVQNNHTLKFIFLIKNLTTPQLKMISSRIRS